MLQNQPWCSPLTKPTLTKGRKERCFWSERWQSGVDSASPKNYFQRFCSSWWFWRGTGKSSQLMGGQTHHHSPLRAGLCAGLLTPCNLRLDVILLTVWSPSLLGRLLKGKLGKKSSHLLITYSSFLCPWFYRKNRQVWQGIEGLKDLKGALGPEKRRAWGCLV